MMWSLLVLQLCLSLCVQALQLHRIGNINAFDNRVTPQELVLELEFSPDEARVYAPEQSSIQLCLQVNGGICRCFHGQIPQLSVSLTEHCLPPSQWSFFFVSVVISTESRGQPLISNPLLIYRPVSSLPEGASIKERLISAGFSPEQLSLLLLLTLDDLSRAAVLFSSLRQHLRNSVDIFEMIVIVPDAHMDALNGALSGLSRGLPFPVTVLAESILFLGPVHQWKADNYGLQMSLKLLASQIIRTPFYLTLDADLVLLRPLSFAALIPQRSQLFESSHNTNQSGYQQLDLQQRAIYEHEPYETHDFWWEGAKYFLNVPNDVRSMAFGVTPALLSTFGALLTTGAVRAVIGVELPLAPIAYHDMPPENCIVLERQLLRKVDSLRCQRMGLDEFDRASAERIWLHSLGTYVWTEYTLYTITLSTFQTFQRFHVNQEESGTFLHCSSVWYKRDLPWDYESAYGNSSCLFSVVQSTSGVRPADVLSSVLKSVRFQSSDAVL